MLILVAALAATAQTTSAWTGAGNGNWLDATNWNNGVPAGATSTALLNAGAAQLNDNGTTTLAGLAIGAATAGAGANGSLSLSNGTLSVVGANEVYIGSGTGNTGALTIGSGTFNLGLASAPGTRVDFVVGAFGGTGTVTQSGGTVLLGSTGGYFHIGNQGTGTYNLQSGSVTVQNAVTLGRSNTSGLGTGTLNISGGSLVLASATKGALLIGGVDGPGAVNGGAGLVHQTGGTVTVGQYMEFGPHGGTGTYDLNGGTLEIGGTDGIKGGSAGSTANFNLGGGTLKVTGSDLTAGVSANLVGGATSTIDTNGLNATWGGNLVGAGLHQVDFGGSSLVKNGTGTLTFSGASRVLDTFAAIQGSTRQTAGTTTAVEFMTGSGAGSNASYLMDGGTLTINASTRADNTTAVAGSLRVGDFGGTGTFTQTAGTVVVQTNGALNIGNQGGTGTYNLQGGTLTLAGGNHVLGRSTGSTAASTGTLNISGGTLELINNSALINGNNLADATHLGTGTINQTGGTLRLTDGRLYVAGFGNGSYNLTGGTLEVGGSGLQARYNNASAAYVFNLGGGTVKVIGSDLTAGLAPTLLANTTSTIDTNGFNATFTSGFSGAGGFAKTGAGRLQWGGASVLSRASTVEGELVIGGATTPGAALTLDAGASLAINGRAAYAGLLRVGAGAAGTLALNGGTIAVNVASGDMTSRVQVGVDAGTGTLTMTGGTLSINDGAAGSSWGTLDVGRGSGSTGTFNQSGGEVVSGGALQVGYENGTGTYNLSGGTLRQGANSGNHVYLGQGAQGNGRLNISGTGQLVMDSQTWADIGTNGSQGRITQTGGTAIFGGSAVAFGTVGEGGPAGTGTYDLQAGTANVTSGTFVFGAGSGGQGTFNQSGGTLTSAVTLVIGDAGTGSYSQSGGTAVLNGGLRLASQTGSTATVNLTGGTLQVGGTNGIARGTGAANLGLGGGTIQVTGSDLTTSVDATLAGATVSTINTHGLNATWAGGLSGAGGLGKSGTGALTLTAANTYTGGTTVGAGTLFVDNTTGSGVGSGALTVATGATLGGSGFIGGLTTIASGGHLAPGNSPGTLTFTHGLTLAGGSVLDFQLGTDSDLIEVTGGTLTGPSSGLVTLNLANSGGFAAATYVLFDFTSVTAVDFDIADFSLGNVIAGYAYALAFDGRVLELTATTAAIPEPSTCAAFAGLVTLGLAIIRRRRAAV